MTTFPLTGYKHGVPGGDVLDLKLHQTLEIAGVGSAGLVTLVVWQHLHYSSFLAALHQVLLIHHLCIEPGEGWRIYNSCPMFSASLIGIFKISKEILKHFMSDS
jgi:hypothetical protein